MQNMTSNIFDSPYYEMFLYGGKDVNDLGDFYQCEAMEEATYSVFSFNVTSIPIVVRFGVCLPSECTFNTLNRGGRALSNLVSAKIQTLGISVISDNHV
jgi:hypothetical protein